MFAQDSAVVASRYAGAFYIGSYDKDGTVKNDITVRAGGCATLPMFERVVLSAQAGYETRLSGEWVAFGKFCFERKSSLVDVGVGYMPRPITLAMRPAPLSAGGHFEPPALAAMPAAGTGAYLAKQFASGWPTVMLSTYYLASSQSVEWNGSVQGTFGSVELRAAGYASRIRKGIAANVVIRRASFTVFTTSDSVFTALLVMPTAVFDPYVNVNYSRARHDFDHLEIGLTKVYQLPYGGAQMLIGIGYQYHSKLLNTYVQLFL